MLSELQRHGNETPIAFAFSPATLTECLKFHEKLQGGLIGPRIKAAPVGSSSGAAKAFYVACWKPSPKTFERVATSTSVNALSRGCSLSLKKGLGVGKTKRGKGMKLMAVTPRRWSSSRRSHNVCFVDRHSPRKPRRRVPGATDRR
jgi:hypothetical protein